MAAGLPFLGDHEVAAGVDCRKGFIEGTDLPADQRGSRPARPGDHSRVRLAAEDLDDPQPVGGHLERFPIDPLPEETHPDGAAVTEPQGSGHSPNGSFVVELTQHSHGAGQLGTGDAAHDGLLKRVLDTQEQGERRFHAVSLKNFRSRQGHAGPRTAMIGAALTSMFSALRAVGP